MNNWKGCVTNLPNDCFKLCLMFTLDDIGFNNCILDVNEIRSTDKGGAIDLLMQDVALEASLIQYLGCQLATKEMHRRRVVCQTMYH